MDWAEDGTQGEESDDWLWDLEERYDLGAVEEQVAAHPSPAADDPRLATVRRYRRSPNEAAAADHVGTWTEADTGPMTIVDDGLSEPRHHHIPPPPPPRHQVNRWAIAAALFVVLGIAVAFALSRRGSGGPVAISSGSTTSTALVGPPGVAVIQTPTNDTTAATAPGTTGSTAPPAPAAVTAPTQGGPLPVFTPIGPTTPRASSGSPAPPPTPRPTPQPTTATTTAPPPPPPPTTPATPPPTSPTTIPTGTTTPATVPPPPTTSPTTPPTTLPIGGG